MEPCGIVAMMPSGMLLAELVFAIEKQRWTGKTFAFLVDKNIHVYKVFFNFGLDKCLTSTCSLSEIKCLFTSSLDCCMSDNNLTDVF